MIDFAAVAAASLVCAAGVMSPGPNFVAVSHRAVTARRAEALAMVFGVACVSALWASSALFGMGLLFAWLPWLFWAVKLLGAGYLVWLGIRLIRNAGQPLAAAVVGAERGSLVRAVRDGMLTNLSNPKSMIFYASVFSAAVPAGATLATQATMVAAVACIAASWYGAVALALSSGRAATAYRRGKPLIERGCGALLILFGLRQALVR